MICIYCNKVFKGHHNAKYCSPVCSVLKKTIQTKNGCLEFTGHLCKGGYGAIRFRGIDMKPHRVIWKHHNGDVPEHLIVRHKCDNPKCCSIDHLELGTHKDNSQDMVDRNRQAKGSNNGCSKLNESDINVIRSLLSKGHTLTSIGNRYGVSHSAIWLIKTNKKWTHVPLGN